MRKHRDFKDYHLDKLRDPEEAQVYLDIALEEYAQDGDSKSFLQALRDVAEVHGGITQLSGRTGLNRQNLYRMLSAEGNPQLKTLGVVLRELGFRLSVEPIRAGE